MIKLINDDILKVDFSGIPPLNLVITSPPYNLGIDYDKHVDTMTYEDYLSWCKEWLNKLYLVLADDGRICINVTFSATPEHLNKIRGDDDINYPVSADYIKICQEVGFKFWRIITWDKNLSNKTCWGSWCSASSPFMRDPSEAILVFYKKIWKRKDKGISTIHGYEFLEWTKNIWRMQPETRSKHPAAFPPELPSRCIKLFSYKDDIICDPFLGSGTTGEVAVRLGRNFIGVEVSPDYYKMAQNRIDCADLQTSLIKVIMPDEDEYNNDFV